MRPELANLFKRPFWLDEWHTNLVANRESLAQVFSDLYRGSDGGPPLLHIVGWALARLTDGVTPVGARIVSLLSVLLALVFVFLVLRRRVGIAAAIAGALAVASHHLVVTHAFELRFYCLWLMCAAGFAWALTLDGDTVTSRRRDAIVALFSVLLCMTHWLAVLSLGLMCVGAMASYGRDWRAGLRRVMPAAAGFVALALSVPLVLAQRASLSETSWMPDVTLGNVLSIVNIYWAGKILVLAVLVILFGLLRAQVKGPLTQSLLGAIRDPGTAALVSLLALPLLMAILSISYPAMHERYSIATLLAWAPVVALAVQSVGRVMRGVSYVVLLAFLWVSIVETTIAATQFTHSATAGKTALAQACGMSLPVVFQVRHLMYPSTDGASRRWARCDTRLLAVSNATLDRMFRAGSSLPRFFRFESELARLHQRLYGYPQVSAQAQLDSLPRFLVVGWDDSFPAGYKSVERFGAAVFPNYRVSRINEDLALFERHLDPLPLSRSHP